MLEIQNEILSLQELESEQDFSQLAEANGIYTVITTKFCIVYASIMSITGLTLAGSAVFFDCGRN